ncbi:MAG: GntR family transcriptional regulator [Pseudomonadota bacterium]|uniref:GntR family transcriptional regulator n=1 Tax=unclassified Phenylobacterium TaxID=2640670 RepID=UPI0009EC6671|nr:MULTISPECIES: GntR family transcriptional regulator [unclassified Phenylobacterium]MBT9470612.1 GntR family transcriptional regulator [Phenylobacterium sp.]
MSNASNVPKASAQIRSASRVVDELEAAPEPVLHASIYEELRRRMITGKIVPGVSLSTRGLALEMGVSQMPVRDALSRLAAEGAVQIRSKRKIEVSAMTAERFADLLDCRLLLEPEAAVQALPNITSAQLKHLRDIDAALDLAMENGDVLGYMEANFRFHFAIYRENNRPTLNRLIEALWLQFGPFMRTVYGRYGTANVVDQHRVALAAIQANDANALREAIASDIRDGMGLIVAGAWAER